MISRFPVDFRFPFPCFCFSSFIHATFPLLVPCCVVSCFLRTNLSTFLFLAICVVIRCVSVSDICYQYFRSALILLNKADPAEVSTCPVCCMHALMSCRFLSTLSHLLIFLVGAGDASGDVIGDAVRDDAGVVVLGVVDPCCPATISALMFLPSADSKAVRRRLRKQFLTHPPSRHH
jgi:hypothetical protein